MVACHHPLIDAGTHSTGSTRGGTRALAALARAGAQVVLSGHVHDPFDLTAETAHGPLRMIGAGTLSRRTRSTPPSFNELTILGRAVQVKVRNPEALPTAAMQVSEVPEGASLPG